MPDEATKVALQNLAFFIVQIWGLSLIPFFMQNKQDPGRINGE
jgi:hypothetical protein